MVVTDLDEDPSNGQNEYQTAFTSDEPLQEKRSIFSKLVNGAATFARYSFASILSTCQYVSSSGNLLVNLEGKLESFAKSKNAALNETITGIATVVNLAVNSFTRIPANYRLLLAKPKKDPYADQETVPLNNKPLQFKDLGWKGRIFYCINLPLSLLSCVFGPLNIYFFSYTVITGLISLVRRFLPAPIDHPDSEEEIRQMGSVIAISVFMLLARVVNTVAYDFKIATKNTLDISKTLDDGELPNYGTILATILAVLPSAVSVTLLAHNSTFKSLEHIAEQLPFHIPTTALSVITKLSTVSATQGHIIKSAPSINAIINRLIDKYKGQVPEEITAVGCATTLSTLFYASSFLSCATDGFTGAASVSGLFKDPHSPTALALSILSGISLSLCAFGLNRQGFFRTMDYQQVQTNDDIEAQRGLLENDGLDDDHSIQARKNLINDLPPRKASNIRAANRREIEESNEDPIYSSPMAVYSSSSR